MGTGAVSTSLALPIRRTLTHTDMATWDSNPATYYSSRSLSGSPFRSSTVIGAADAARGSQSTDPNNILVQSGPCALELVKNV